MFSAADALLKQAGMEFPDVVRTWIHLREMDRDYADLNRARRVFFDARGLLADEGPWRDQLDHELNRCRATLAIVGPDWMDRFEPPATDSPDDSRAPVEDIVELVGQRRHDHFAGRHRANDVGDLTDAQSTTPRSLGGSVP